MITPLAHLTATGFGPWVDGMARLFLEPTELLLVIGLVLLDVQANRAVSNRLPLLLPLALLLGGLIGLRLPSPLLLAVGCAGMLAALGLLVALGLRLRQALLTIERFAKARTGVVPSTAMPPQARRCASSRSRSWEVGSASRPAAWLTTPWISRSRWADSKAVPMA